MRSDPKPDDRILVFNAQGAPADTNTNRIDIVFLADLFELKAGVIWMFSPDLIASASTPLCMTGKPFKAF